MKKQIKIAMCFASEIRDGYLLHESIKNLLSSNEKYELKVDYFLHTWNHTYLKDHNNWDENVINGDLDPSEFSFEKRTIKERLPADEKKLELFLNNYNINNYKIEDEDTYTTILKYNGLEYYGIDYIWLGINWILEEFIGGNKYDIIICCRPDICFNPESKLVNNMDTYLEKINDTIFHHEGFMFFSSAENIKKLVKSIRKIDSEEINLKLKDYSGEKIFTKFGFNAERFASGISYNPAILRPETTHLDPIKDWDEIYRINKLLYT
jgi:hypothetical protein